MGSAAATPPLYSVEEIALLPVVRPWADWRVARKREPLGTVASPR
ncbi:MULTISPECIES: hypothetical protein [unclassified Streptomyces]